MMKLSMITVCRNAEDCIARTMESVLFQTLPVYEYVLVDGDSDDGTMGIIESYKTKFEEKGINFRCFSEKDEGISDAFNKGIRIATGNWIGLINADDELMLETNEKIANAVRSMKNADVLFGNAIWIDYENQLSYIIVPKEINGKRMNRLLYEMVLIHPATFIRKSAYEKYGIYDISFRYCMDQELLYRMYRQGASFVYINNILAKLTAGGVSDVNPQKVFKEASRIALNAGESRYKVEFIEKKKYLRNRTAFLAKKVGVYKVLRKQDNE